MNDLRLKIKWKVAAAKKAYKALGLRGLWFFNWRSLSKQVRKELHERRST